MNYYMDEDSTVLGDLRKRLETTDLIPSHQPLLERIGSRFTLLEQAGCKSVRELRARLKTQKTVALFAKDSGVDTDYLTLLRRVVEGIFPKPQPLTAFDWLDTSTLAKLEKISINNTEQLHLAARSGLAELVERTGLQAKDLSEAIALSNLSRVQWVSPTFARMLVMAGFDSATKVANANPDELCNAIAAANKDAQLYKGKVGLRDIKRLVVAASYVPDA